MSEEVSSRSSRRNAQKTRQTITGFSKRTNIAVAGGLVAFLAASAGVGLTMSKESSVPLTKTPEKLSANLFFQSSDPIEGWKKTPSAILEGRGNLTSAQNPEQFFSTDEKCSYSRQVLHIPSFQEGRTDDFLTRQYLYEVAQSNGSAAKDTEVVQIASDKGKLDFLSASYQVKPTSSADKDKDTSSTATVYRSNAVRAIDKIVQIEGVKKTDGLFGSDASQGIPVFFLSYECKTQADWNADTWKSLLDSTKLSLYTEAVPEQTKPETGTTSEASPSEAPSSTPSPSVKASEKSEPAVEESASSTDGKEPDTAESTEDSP
jgi:hypothetical protein